MYQRRFAKLDGNRWRISRSINECESDQIFRSSRSFFRFYSRCTFCLLNVMPTNATRKRTRKAIKHSCRSDRLDDFKVGCLFARSGSAVNTRRNHKRPESEIILEFTCAYLLFLAKRRLQPLGMIERLAMACAREIDLR